VSSAPLKKGTRSHVDEHIEGIPGCERINSIFHSTDRVFLGSVLSSR